MQIGKSIKYKTNLVIKILNEQFPFGKLLLKRLILTLSRITMVESESFKKFHKALNECSIKQNTWLIKLYKYFDN